MMKRCYGTLFLSLVFVCMMTVGMMAQERTTVTVWLIGDAVGGAYSNVWDQMKERIEEELPHIEVDMHFGVSPDERYTLAYAANIAPDVVTLKTEMAPQFINAGMIVPIDYEVFGVEDAEGLKDYFYPGALKSMYTIDDIYFMPVETSLFGMYYNKDLMEEVGIGANQVPRTWDEIIEIGKKFMVESGDGVSFDRVGLALNTGWLWPTFRWAALIRQAGVDWMEDGQSMFASPEAMQAFTKYASLFHEDQVTIPTTGQGAFLNGRAPFYLGPSYETRETHIAGQADFDWGTSGYPSLDPNNRVSTSYSWGLFVSSQSKVQKEAWEVINWLTSEEWAPVWFDTSSLLIPRAGDWLIETIADVPQMEAFIYELEFAQIEIIHEQYQQINSAIVAADNAIIHGTDNVGNILRELNHTIQVLLDE